MTQIFKLNHPASYDSDWNETHLILVAVHSFKLLSGGLRKAFHLGLTYDQFKNTESVRVVWQTLERNGKKYVHNANTKGINAIEDDKVATKYVTLRPQKWNTMIVIAKKESSDISKLNDFLVDVIETNFQYSSVMGWSLRG